MFDPISNSVLRMRSGWRTTSIKETVEYLRFTLLCHLQEVRLICPEALSGVSRGGHPEIASESNFRLPQDLVLFLRQFGRKTVDDLGESSEQNLLLCWLSTNSAVCIFSGIHIVCLQNLLSQQVLQSLTTILHPDRIISNNNYPISANC